MAQMEVDPEKGLVVVDLHGYSVETALEVARAVMAQAYENGFSFVQLIHGHSTSLPRGHWSGAPTIKEQLLRLLEEGAFAPYASSRRSRRHQRRPGSLTIALGPNPSPNPSPIWSALPERDYSEKRR